MSMNPVLSM